MTDDEKTRTVGYRDTLATVYAKQDRIEVRVHDGVKTGQHLLVLDTEEFDELLATLRDASRALREMRRGIYP